MNLKKALGATLATAAMAAGLLAGGAGQATANPEERGGPPWCRADSTGSYDADKMPERVRRADCDLRGKQLRRGALNVAVPGEGEAAGGAGLGHPGEPGDELYLTTEPNGDVVITGEPVELPTVPGGPAECDDTAYGVATAYKVKTTLNWGFRSGTNPGLETNANVESAIRGGLSGLLSHANNCGEARDPNALGLNYTGPTATASNITSTGCSSSLDASHVVDFGPLPSKYVALACFNYTSGGATFDFDIRMNNGYTFDATTTNGCNNGYDIVSVMTHEWGHIYGLSHVDEATHGFQTMSTAFNGAGCQQSERTLARGDMAHMFAKYGVK